MFIFGVKRHSFPRAHLPAFDHNIFQHLPPLPWPLGAFFCAQAAFASLISFSLRS
jgi:hypothetical protein